MSKKNQKFTTNSKPTGNKDFSDDNYSGLKLFKMEYEKLPTLLEPIFPKQGLVSLIGSSDTGKSTFLRQMALSIVLGLDDFIGYKLNTDTKNVIFISTEDDPASVSISIKKPLAKLLKQHKIDTSALNHLKFIFDKKRKRWAIIQKLHQQGLSVRKIETALKTKGFSIGKSSVYNYIKDIKTVN